MVLKEDTPSLKEECVLPIGLRKRYCLTLFAQRFFKSELTMHLRKKFLRWAPCEQALADDGQFPKLNFSGQKGDEKSKFGVWFLWRKKPQANYLKNIVR